MANAFTLTGEWRVSASTGRPSLDPAFTASINEAITLDKRHFWQATLESDALTTVDMGGLNAHVLIVDATAKCKLHITSADGTAQVIPISSLVLINRDVPITALSVTRLAGTDTDIKVFVGQSA